jgi:hypothetical protein
MEFENTHGKQNNYVVTNFIRILQIPQKQCQHNQHNQHNQHQRYLNK